MTRVLYQLRRNVAYCVHWLYKHSLSPLFGNSCRFKPSYSTYARDAIVLHGVLRGTVLSVARISRCHPWHSGGVDPVPPPKINGRAESRRLADKHSR